MSRSPDPAVAERRDKVLALRARGLSFALIAEQVGLPNAAAAGQDLYRALEAAAKLNDEAAAMEPTLKLERLARMEQACQFVLASASSAGDHAMVLAATDRLLKISEQRTAVRQYKPPGELARERYA
jgi:hypothetical protein